MELKQRTFLTDGRQPQLDFLGRGFVHIFEQIASTRVKTLSDTNLVA